MRQVLYLGALTCSEYKMAATEAIVYSQALYRAICRQDKAFGNKFNLQPMRLKDGWYVPFEDKITISFVDGLNVSKSQFYEARNALREAKFITEHGIKCTRQIITTFFELKAQPGLSGMSLIVYSYLVNKTERYGKVSQNHEKMASELGIRRGSLERILTELRKLESVKIIKAGRYTHYTIEGVTVKKHKAKPSEKKQAPAQRPKPVQPQDSPRDDDENDKAGYSMSEIIAGLRHSLSFPT